MSKHPRFPSDPKLWGTGVWWSLHTLAFDVEQNDIPYFIKSLIKLCDSLPCPKCRGHAMKFLENFPPKAKITSADKSAFIYTFDLHNHVNDMTRKGKLDYATAFELYKKVEISNEVLPAPCPDGTSSCLSVPEVDTKVKRLMKFRT